MSRLAEIPIRIESLPETLPGAAAAGGLGGGVAALLTEIASLLARLAETRLPAAIDLRSLPMSPQDRSELEQRTRRRRSTRHDRGRGPFDVA